MDKEFLLVRDYFKPAIDGKEGFTLGTLSYEGKAVCYTCEDEDRQLEIHPEAKVYGKTAIPRGRYRVTLSFSHRFGKVLPELHDVPGYSGVRIHKGNTSGDSAGCLLVGQQRTSNGVAKCDVPMQRIMDILQQAEDSGETVWMKII